MISSLVSCFIFATILNVIRACFGQFWCSEVMNHLFLVCRVKNVGCMTATFIILLSISSFSPSDVKLWRPRFAFLSKRFIEWYYMFRRRMCSTQARMFFHVVVCLRMKTLSLVLEKIWETQWLVLLVQQDC